jgi:septal ring factor EnvC (AmiA/AmiB activator)
MNRARFGVVFAILGTLTLWGCATQPSGEAANKTTRLQEELSAITTVRDKLRQDLKTAQKERDGLGEELAKLKNLMKERDEQLATRTTERDQTQANLEQLRKGIKALMEQATGMGPTPTESAPVTTANTQTVGKS